MHASYGILPCEVDDTELCPNVILIETFARR
jgi:hypothetical protein